MTAQENITQDQSSPITIAAEATKVANGMLAVANAYEIDCPEMAECAADDMNAWAGKVKELNETRLSLTRPLDESKKRIMELFAAPIATAQSAVDQLKRNLLAWNQKEAARIAAEREAAEAERRREEEEARKQAAALEAQKQEAIATGDADLLDELEEKSMIVEKAASAVLFAPPVMQHTAAVSGASIRKKYKAEVVDLMALVKAVAAGRASIDLLEANMSVLNKRAGALGAEMKIDGVRVYEEQSIAATGRKR